MVFLVVNSQRLLGIRRKSQHLSGFPVGISKDVVGSLIPIEDCGRGANSA